MLKRLSQKGSLFFLRKTSSFHSLKLAYKFGNQYIYIVIFIDFQWVVRLLNLTIKTN